MKQTQTTSSQANVVRSTNTRSKPSIILSAVVLTSIAGFSFAAFAHGGATGVVKERMDLMSNIGKAQKSLAAMFSGKEKYNVQAVRDAATIIENHAGDKINNLFPKGTVEHPSEALPSIWQNWSEFKNMSDQLAVYAAALKANAGNSRAGAQGQKKPAMGMGAGAMMGQKKTGMMGGSGSSMGAANTAMSAKQQVEMLAKMPPMASFQKVAQTCSACHTKFRKKKSK